MSQIDTPSVSETHDRPAFLTSLLTLKPTEIPDEYRYGNCWLVINHLYLYYYYLHFTSF